MNTSVAVKAACSSACKANG